ncbi:reverse transcriptase domain-containing protein [Tanacetum coccineum]
MYHPQANGAVEWANQSIMQGINTRLHQEGGAWVEELPNVLWAHKTTPKKSNRETPFSLAYGTEAVIPAEIGIPIKRMIQGYDEENEEALRLNLNLLKERREIATIREARRKQQVKKYYNQRVRHKQFKAETRAKLKESRTPLVGFYGERNPPRIQAPDPEGTTSTGREESQEQTNKVGEPEDTIQRPPIPSNENTQTDEKDKEKNEPLEKSFGSKPPEKVVIHNDYPDQTITIRGNLSIESRSGLIEMLCKHADAFVWTLADLTGIPRFIEEHELKTYPT